MKMLVKSKKRKAKNNLLKIAIIISLSVFIYAGLAVAYTASPAFANKFNSFLGSFGSAKASTNQPSAELVDPWNGQVFRVVPGWKQRIVFTADVKSEGTPVQANVIYQRVGDSIWTSFGTKPTKDVSGRLTKPNNRTAKYMDAEGWSCNMNFAGSTPPADCYSTFVKNGVTSYSALSGEKIYFPAVDLGPGTYRWAIKGKTKGSEYVSWTTTKWFNVRNLEKVYNSVRTTKKMVALTFDDGPEDTKYFCDTLKRYNSKATFFFVGDRLANATGEAAIANSCGEVGNHTQNHINFTATTNFSTSYPQFASYENLLQKISGQRTTWARPRGGVVNSSIIDAALRTNEVIINYSIITNDYGPDNPSRQTVVNRVVNSANLKPGAIIVLHQRYLPTKYALPTILSILRDKGYTVTTVSELINNSY